ncbi:MAG TPA: hypothetical protein VHE81_22260, partial [Lacipirellulaceae bacterium]|nr:hypothetical protein [Lacipirellulaceae bacterium]
PTLRRVVAGFRRDGALSVFFGDDVVYQFNAAGELRRAYSEGLLLKAMRGRLASLQRVRTPRETQLVRQDLTYAEQSAFLAQMTRHLSELKSALDNCRFETVGQVPPDADVLARLQGWLRTQDEFQIAARPNVGR